MLVEHRGKRPTVHESAWVAPTAVICGDVHVGEDAHGEPRGDDLMARVMLRQTAWLGAHRDDRVL